MKIHEIVILVIILFVVLGNVNMQRSPMPTFGFSNKLIKIKENSLEYRMQMALLTTDPNESYNKVEELLKEGASPDKKAGQFKWIDTNLCIKENLLTIFPLLIEYGAILDKKSLELAEITTERTGSLEMKKLVLAQWKKQNKNKHKS